MGRKSHGAGHFCRGVPPLGGIPPSPCPSFGRGETESTWRCCCPSHRGLPLQSVPRPGTTRDPSPRVGCLLRSLPGPEVRQPWASPSTHPLQSTGGRKGEAGRQETEGGRGRAPAALQVSAPIHAWRDLVAVKGGGIFFNSSGAWEWCGGKGKLPLPPPLPPPPSLPPGVTVPVAPP